MHITLVRICFPKCKNQISSGWQWEQNTIKIQQKQLQVIIQHRGMSKNLKQDLLRLAESITTNIHYPCNLGNLNILFQYQFYFDICQIIFPNLSIQLLKIKEDDSIQATQKMDLLIHLIVQETEYDLTSIQGAEVIKGENISHLLRFLGVLQKFSEMYKQGSQDSSSLRVRSDPNTSSRLEDKMKGSMSARENWQNNMISESEDEQKVSNMSEKKKNNKKKKPPSYSNKKENRSRAESCKNLYSQLANIMMIEKNRAIKASLRDNRKSKNQDIIAAKNKYKSYLLNFAKQNRAQKNRQSLQKQSKSKPRNELPISQLSNIQNFFKSFELKLRDQKYCYLKRIQKLIKNQQKERLHHQTRIQKQQNTKIQKSTTKQVQKLENEHRIRSTLLREELQSEKQANKIVKKQYDRYLREQKRELKDNKKKEIGKIGDFMNHQNSKVLLTLEQGGRLEEVILAMYKRF